MDYLKLKNRWSESLRDLYSKDQVNLLQQEKFLKQVSRLAKIKEVGSDDLLLEMYQVSREIAEALGCRTSRSMMLISYALDIWPTSLGDVNHYISTEIKGRVQSFCDMLKESCYDIDKDDVYAKDLLMSIELDILANELHDKLPYEKMAVYYQFSEMKCYRAMYLLGEMLHPWSKKEHCHDIGKKRDFHLIDLEMSRIYLLEALNFYKKAFVDKHHPSYSVSHTKDYRLLIGKIQGMLGSARVLLGINNDEACNEAFYRYVEAIEGGYGLVVRDAINLMIMPNSSIEVDLSTMESLIFKGEKAQDSWSIKMRGRIELLCKQFYETSMEEEMDDETEAVNNDCAIMYAVSEHFWPDFHSMAEMYMNLLMTPSLPTYNVKKASKIAQKCLEKEREFQMAALTFASSALDLDDHMEQAAKIVCKLAESGNKEAYINYGIILFNHSEWIRSALYLIKGLKHLGNDVDNDTRSNIYLKIADAYIHSKNDKFKEDIIRFLQRGFALGFITAGYKLCVYFLYLGDYGKAEFYLRQVLGQINRQKDGSDSPHPMDDLNILEYSTKRHLGILHTEMKLIRSDHDFGITLLKELESSGYIGSSRRNITPEIELGLYKTNGIMH